MKISGGEGLVINSGTIWGTNDDGVYLGDGGGVYNQRHGTITGGNNGVTIYGDTGYVSNDGTISGLPAIIGSSPTVSSAGNIKPPSAGTAFTWPSAARWTTSVTEPSKALSMAWKSSAARGLFPMTAISPAKLILRILCQVPANQLP